MVCFSLKYNLPFKQIDETQVQIVSWNNQTQPNLVSSQLIQNEEKLASVCPIIVVTTSLVCKTCTSVSLFIWASIDSMVNIEAETSHINHSILLLLWHSAESENVCSHNSRTKQGKRNFHSISFICSTLIWKSLKISFAKEGHTLINLIHHYILI